MLFDSRCTRQALVAKQHTWEKFMAKGLDVMSSIWASDL